MLKEGTILPIQSPYASPVVLCRKNNWLPPVNPEAYRFAVDYRKLIAITKYPRYPLPLMDDLINNIPHTTIMSSLDLRSGLLQEAGLTLNEDESKFGCDKLKYLGLVNSKDGITMDEAKVKAIKEMKPPKNSKVSPNFLVHPSGM
ncbi:retrovirus-related Pol polyprotein from transposon 17.6 [Trichonephila clavipes]|nr:retrovirus-related Pol polyprotein from transposon 17.6 [Trichonephila clavipes]